MIVMSSTSANYRSREQADGSVGKEELDPSRSPYGMHSPIIIPMLPPVPANHHYKAAGKAKDWAADHGKDCLRHLLRHCTGLWDFLGLRPLPMGDGLHGSRHPKKTSVQVIF